jgi:hypothetical protein
VRTTMSFPAKRELLIQIAPRYAEATPGQKGIILGEFIQVTGYTRKYAIRILSQCQKQPISIKTVLKRDRPRKYGKEVQEALATTWAASNFICAKRLVPFLPELVSSLERHGHLKLPADTRQQLLAISSATADRILTRIRKEGQPKGIGTTKAGTLLKHQVPIRTFAEWNEVKPGFLEIDLVAHCGYGAEGSYLYTLTLTDVATGWTECQALLHRGKSAVMQALERARKLLPFPVLGIDSDNGVEFINNDLIAYCVRENITFTRGRAYRKNDQCFVEQKNGAVVRQLVGYDRFEGEQSYRQLAELYRAIRLHTNIFQPSMKLLLKRGDGSDLYRKYDTPQTPLQRLLATNILGEEAKARLVEISKALDPVQLLNQLVILQNSLWKQAVLRGKLVPVQVPEIEADKVLAETNQKTAKAVQPIVEPIPIKEKDKVKTKVEEVRFDSKACIPLGSPIQIVVGGEVQLQPFLKAVQGFDGKRKYQKSQKPRLPRTYRTRKDPFEAVNTELKAAIMAEPGRTSKSLFVELQERYPGQYRDVWLRTLQRRVHEWRSGMIIEFDDGWLHDELISVTTLPKPLQGKIAQVAKVGADLPSN